jgi:hypothetical protein
MSVASWGHGPFVATGSRSYSNEAPLQGLNQPAEAGFVCVAAVSNGCVSVFWERAVRCETIHESPSRIREWQLIPAGIRVLVGPFVDGARERDTLAHNMKHTFGQQAL